MTFSSKEEYYIIIIKLFNKFLDEWKIYVYFSKNTMTTFTRVFLLFVLQPKLFTRPNFFSFFRFFFGFFFGVEKCMEWNSHWRAKFRLIFVAFIDDENDFFGKNKEKKVY